MSPPPSLTTPDDPQRLEALRRFGILDTEAEEAFDRITRLAASIMGVPISVLSFVDDARHWLKAAGGPLAVELGMPERTLPRDSSLCLRVIESDEPIAVFDLLGDPVLAQNPTVCGSPYIRFYAGAPLITHDGYRIGALSIADIVDHTSFPDQQKKHLSDLAQIVMDEMELRITIRSRADFVAMISHEIRTPMNGVLGMTELLLDEPMSAEIHQSIEVIHASANTLLQVVNDVLDFAKLEAHQLQLEKVNCSFPKIVDAVVKLFKTQADKKHVEIKLNFPETLPLFVCDPSRLQQILFNLVGNALKFTSAGSITITIKPTESPDGKILWDVRVRDTGIGIAADDIPKLFKPFSQAESSTMRRFGGTGLGLVITKLIVKLLDGTIGLTSEVNKGTEFFFSFVADPSAQQQKEISGTTENDAPLHILVGEDDPTNRLVIESMLKKLRHTYKILPDGAAVLQEAEQNPYDLILMDIEMPKMTGLEATATIRESKSPYRNVPIVALTANALSEQQKEYAACGMTDYLAKPIRLEQLKKVIARNSPIKK